MKTKDVKESSLETKPTATREWNLCADRDTLVENFQKHYLLKLFAQVTYLQLDFCLKSFTSKWVCSNTSRDRKLIPFLAIPSTAGQLYKLEDTLSG